MIRALFSMMLSIMVGRWIYDEIGTHLPVLTPIVDSALDVVRIPTHEKWSKQAIEKFVDNALGIKPAMASDATFETDRAGFRSPKR